MTTHPARIVALATLAVLAACSEPRERATGPGAAAPDGSAIPAAVPATVAGPEASPEAKERDALAAGVEGVVYGLPLVIMDITRRKSTNVAKPAAFGAPVNEFAHVRAFPDASFKDVVRANVDTLYSSAWLDLANEPVVLSVPDTRGRYYLMPMLDAWTNVFASPGKRTTGTRAGHYAITGPGWEGKLPAGVKQLKSPTNMVWIIGRTQTNGPKDYAAVRAIQDRLQLVPLSAFGKRYVPAAGSVDASIDMTTPPVDQLRRMGSEAFFDRLAQLMKANPAPAADAPMLAKLRTLGIVPGERFDASKLDPAVAAGLRKSLEVALAKLDEAARTTGAPVNGWRMPSDVTGHFGTEYGERAVVALVGLGANLPQDAVYPSAFVDGTGASLNGAHRYVIRFEKGATPPVNAFWSLTLYDPSSFFVPNPIDRYAISSWMPLARNKDGSIEILVQREVPGKDKASNWLPAPAGEFNVTMRMYWPSDKAPSIIDGTWKPPPIARVP